MSDVTKVQKTCPVVFRRDEEGIQVLAFRHPLAGLQLVKGTIEPGECLEAAALRELSEESGINAVTVRKLSGWWESEHDNQIWSFALVDVPWQLPERWVHFTADGGGLELEFFWHSLFSPVTSEWHPVFQRALRFLQTADFPLVPGTRHRQTESKSS